MQNGGVDYRAQIWSPSGINYTRFYKDCGDWKINACLSHWEEEDGWRMSSRCLFNLSRDKRTYKTPSDLFSPGLNHSGKKDKPGIWGSGNAGELVDNRTGASWQGARIAGNITDALHTFL
jgi:hypothetical protein